MVISITIRSSSHSFGQLRKEGGAAIMTLIPTEYVPHVLRLRDFELLRLASELLPVKPYADIS